MLKDLLAKSPPDYLSSLQQWPKSSKEYCHLLLFSPSRKPSSFIPYNPANKVVCIQRSLRWSSALSLIKLMEPAGILLISLDVWLPQWWPHLERVRRQGLGSPPPTTVITEVCLFGVFVSFHHSCFFLCGLLYKSFNPLFWSVTFQRS